MNDLSKYIIENLKNNKDVKSSNQCEHVTKVNIIRGTKTTIGDFMKKYLLKKSIKNITLNNLTKTELKKYLCCLFSNRLDFPDIKWNPEPRFPETKYIDYDSILDYLKNNENQIALEYEEYNPWLHKNVLRLKIVEEYDDFEGLELDFTL